MQSTDGLFGGVSRGAYFSSAKMLPRWKCSASGNLSLIDNASNSYNATVAGFWSYLDGARGVAVDSNFSAGVEKTILSLAGGAVLQNIVGPAAVGTETHSIRVVVDGVSWSTAAITMSANARLVLGFICDSNLYGATSTNDFIWGPTATATDDTTGFRSNNNGVFLPGFSLEIFGTPLVLAQQSLQVFVTSSANITATANNERQSGVAFRAI